MTRARLVSRAACMAAVLSCWAALECQASMLLSPADAVATANRLGVDGPGGGVSGGSQNTIGGWGFPGNVIDIATDPAYSTAHIWYVAAGPPQQLYYDLGAPMFVESVVIWNDNTANDIAALSHVDVGTTTGTPASFSVANLAALSWTNDIAGQALDMPEVIGTGQVFSFASPVLTRYLRVNATANTSGTTEGFWGFNEFAVIAVPEPQSIALLGLGMVAIGGCVWRRSKRF